MNEAMAHFLRGPMDDSTARHELESARAALLQARIAPVSRFRNSLHLISASFEFRNRKDTGQDIDASVVLASKFAKGADIGDVANFETTTLEEGRRGDALKIIRTATQSLKPGSTR